MSEAGSSGRSISLRPINADDSSLLLEIYRSTRAEELALVSWWTEEQKNAFVQMQSDAQHSHYRNTFPQAEYLVVQVDTRAVGRLYLAELESELRILDLTLMPHERNAGVGSYLLERLIEESKSKRKPLSIHVESFSPAIDLLERLGFKKVGENGIYFLMEHASEQLLTA